MKPVLSIVSKFAIFTALALSLAFGGLASAQSSAAVKRHTIDGVAVRCVTTMDGDGLLVSCFVGGEEKPRLTIRQSEGGFMAYPAKDGGFGARINDVAYGYPVARSAG